MPTLDYTTPGADTFTCPYFVHEIDISGTGGGQAGFLGVDGDHGGNGGAGGDWVRNAALAVTPTEVYDIVVANGGNDNNGAFGENTTLSDDTPSVLFTAGGGGQAVGAGNVGGAGGAGDSSEGGGGGGAGASGGAGSAGADAVGSPPAAGGAAGSGGTGTGGNGSSSSDGSNGTAPGGGGGGGSANGGTNGGAGAAGDLHISYTYEAPTFTLNTVTRGGDNNWRATFDVAMDDIATCLWSLLRDDGAGGSFTEIMTGTCPSDSFQITCPRNEAGITFRFKLVLSDPTDTYDSAESSIVTIDFAPSRPRIDVETKNDKTVNFLITVEGLDTVTGTWSLLRDSSEVDTGIIGTDQPTDTVSTYGTYSYELVVTSDDNAEETTSPAVSVEFGKYKHAQGWYAPGTPTWTTPQFVDQVAGVVVGGGGGGGGSSSAGYGGAGSGYDADTLAVSPGEVCNVVAPAGGITDTTGSGNGSQGQDGSFTAVSGNVTGGGGSYTGGAGGSGLYVGGTGGSASGGYGGAGGSSAGSASAGSNGSNGDAYVGYGATAPAGGGDGGDGDGADFSAALPGSFPGGGGGAGDSGVGASGYVYIEWEDFAPTIESISAAETINGYDLTFTVSTPAVLDDAGDYHLYGDPGSADPTTELQVDSYAGGDDEIIFVVKNVAYGEWSFQLYLESGSDISKLSAKVTQTFNPPTPELILTEVIDQAGIFEVRSSCTSGTIRLYRTDDLATPIQTTAAARSVVFLVDPLDAVQTGYKASLYAASIESTKTDTVTAAPADTGYESEVFITAGSHDSVVPAGHLAAKFRIVGGGVSGADDDGVSTGGAGGDGAGQFSDTRVLVDEATTWTITVGTTGADSTIDDPSATLFGTAAASDGTAGSAPGGATGGSGGASQATNGGAGGDGGDSTASTLLLQSGFPGFYPGGGGGGAAYVAGASTALGVGARGLGVARYRTTAPTQPTTGATHRWKFDNDVLDTGYPGGLDGANTGPVDFVTTNLLEHHFANTHAASSDSTSKYVELGDVDLDGLSNWSLSMWIKNLVSSSAENSRVFLSTNGVNRALSLNYGSLFYFISGSSSPGFIDGFVVDEWHLLTITYAGGNMAFYVDGEQAATLSVSENFLGDAYTLFNSSGNAADIIADDLRVYDYALSQNEINWILDGGDDPAFTPSTGFGMLLSGKRNHRLQ